MNAQRLAGETSPYLRLHATNPVNWYPWGEEAFARARAEDKPIFLSIGYYTCHWCHVMERESFSDTTLAQRLNRDFIAIKVDREERPDVDRLYMTFVQATTGGGGWPLSAFLAPDLKPFYGGTYYPPQDRPGSPSFTRVLQTIAQAWRDERPRLLQSATEVAAYLARATQPAPRPAGASSSPAALQAQSWPRLWDHYRSSFDPAEGGFGSAPKFPRPVAHSFLLRFAHRHQVRPESAQAIRMVVETLRAMARGGMHDALGGGFHRYSTDAGWRVPHFEKMLYDQAQLAVSLLEAWQLTREPDLAATARSTLDFVLREMTAPDGGFFSAQDADSSLPDDPTREGEGAYYVWTWAEIAAHLDATTSAAFHAHYGVLPQGNVPPGLDPQGEFTGKNILFGAPTPELAPARAQLYAIRRLRPHPPTDEKILTAWNGLMISALASGAAALDDAAYLVAARRAATFLRDTRWNATTATLLRTAAIPAFVEDYAYLIQGLLDLHQADFDPQWLDWARELQLRQEALFADPQGGYYSAGEDPNLWLRLREDYDGAEPSPNSVALSNLLRLAVWFEGERWRDRAYALVASFASRLAQLPEAMPLMAAHLEMAASPERRLTIAGLPDAPDTRALLRVVRARFLPGTIVSLIPPAPGGAAAAFVCEDRACQLPISDPEMLAGSL